MGKSSFETRGKHYILPIVNDRVAQIRFGSPGVFSLGFRDDQQVDTADIVVYPVSQGDPGSRVEVELTRGSHELLKTRLYADVAELGALLAVCDQTVTEATAGFDGVLQLQFANKLRLTITPFDYEAWHFHGYGKTLTGAGGQLI